MAQPPLPEAALSLIVPAFNEAERLGATLDELARFTAASRWPVEVVLVDDGSSDGTFELLTSFSRRQNAGCATVLRNDGNRGKGFSVRRGMLAARGDHLLFTDADLSTPLSEAETLLAAAAAGAQVVIGSRAMPGSRILTSQSRFRTLGGKALNVCIQLVALRGIHDSQCGFKLFTRRAAHDIFARATIDRFSFDVEVLYLARKLGYRVAEVPVRWTNMVGSKVSPIRDGLRLLAELCAIRLRDWRGGYAAPPAGVPAPED
jgi:dolichyl-phosphate beta-glucosyltransferase